MTEIWKDVEGYEGLYKVSNLGRVMSFVNSQSHIVSEGHLIKPINQKGNYKHIGLQHKGVIKQMCLHRLVALAFIPIPERLKNLPMEKIFIDHINGNPADNRVENLRWCTAQENASFPLARYRKSVGKIGKHYASLSKENSAKAHAVIQYTKDWELVKEWACIQYPHEAGIAQSANISKVCRGERNFAGGFRWKYA